MNIKILIILLLFPTIILGYTRYDRIDKIKQCEDDSWYTVTIQDTNGDYDYDTSIIRDCEGNIVRMPIEQSKNAPIGSEIIVIGGAEVNNCNIDSDINLEFEYEVHDKNNKLISICRKYCEKDTVYFELPPDSKTLNSGIESMTGEARYITEPILRFDEFDLFVEKVNTKLADNQEVYFKITTEDNIYDRFTTAKEVINFITDFKSNKKEARILEILLTDSNGKRFEYKRN